MVFIEVVGTGAVLCYVVAIFLDNAGFGALALGLTMYALKYGVGG